MCWQPRCQSYRGALRLPRLRYRRRLVRTVVSNSLVSPPLGSDGSRHTSEGFAILENGLYKPLTESRRAYSNRRPLLITSARFGVAERCTGLLIAHTEPCGNIAPPVIDGTLEGLLRRPPEEDRAHCQARVRLGKATWANIATRYGLHFHTPLRSSGVMNLRPCGRCFSNTAL
jgi:hypothetical protein